MHDITTWQAVSFKPKITQAATIVLQGKPRAMDTSYRRAMRHRIFDLVSRTTTRAKNAKVEPYGYNNWPSYSVQTHAQGVMRRLTRATAIPVVESLRTVTAVKFIRWQKL